MMLVNSGDQRSAAIVSKLAGCLGPVLILPLHISIVYHFWCDYTRKVNKNLCSCSCWDSVFKGPYESGVASYKHVYFNSTSNSFKIWALTVTVVLLFYESCCYLIRLLVHHRARYSMVGLFLSSMFSHYYSWWMFFNYWNDEYYSQWYHQLFFSLTEILSTCYVLLLADRAVQLTAYAALPIAAIAVVHITLSCWDQFFINVLRGEGYSFQVVRDVGFMVPDILHVVIPVWQLRTLQRSKLQKGEYLLFTSVVALGLLIGYANYGGVCSGYILFLTTCLFIGMEKQNAGTLMLAGLLAFRVLIVYWYKSSKTPAHKLSRPG